MSRTIEQDWKVFRDRALGSNLEDLDPEMVALIEDTCRHAFYLGAQAQHNRLGQILCLRAPHRRLSALDETSAELAEYRQHTHAEGQQIED